MRNPRGLVIATILSIALFAAACGTPEDAPDDGTETIAAVASATTAANPDEAATAAGTPDALQTADVEATADVDAASDLATSTFLIEVWADNWMAVYVDGQLIGEDSVPITTERSFNSESFTFEAAYPFTIGIEAKDFKETDSGIEYIGQPNQQMGDGGLIAQVTDTATGEVVAVTSADWSVLVVHQAPLNPDCANDPDPDATCEFEITETPIDWADGDFDDTGWATATEWSAADVDPKDGYLDINWDGAAQFIWGADLEIDNTVLTRMTVTADGLG